MSACRRCGLRAAPRRPQADQATLGGPAGRAPATPASRGWRALAAVLVGSACWPSCWWSATCLSARRDDDGSISAGGTLAIEDLRVGDCFNSRDEADEISEVDARALRTRRTSTRSSTSPPGPSATRTYPSDDSHARLRLRRVRARVRGATSAWPTSRRSSTSSTFVAARGVVGRRATGSSSASLYDPGDDAAHRVAARRQPLRPPVSPTRSGRATASACGGTRRIVSAHAQSDVDADEDRRRACRGRRRTAAGACRGRCPVPMVARMAGTRLAATGGRHRHREGAAPPLGIERRPTEWRGRPRRSRSVPARRRLSGHRDDVRSSPPTTRPVRDEQRIGLVAGGHPALVEVRLAPIGVGDEVPRQVVDRDRSHDHVELEGEGQEAGRRSADRCRAGCARGGRRSTVATISPGVEVGRERLGRRRRRRAWRSGRGNGVGVGRWGGGRRGAWRRGLERKRAGDERESGHRTSRAVARAFPTDG